MNDRTPGSVAEVPSLETTVAPSPIEADKMPSTDKKEAPASRAKRSSAAKDVEPVVDPKMPDGIPVVKEGRKVKDPESAPVEECPVCGNAFRHHVKDKEGQCPHCEAFLALDAEPREPSPPSDGPKSEKAEARAAKRARKQAEKERKKAVAADKKAAKKKTKNGGDVTLEAEPGAAETSLFVEEEHITIEETLPLEVEEEETSTAPPAAEGPVVEEEIGLEVSEEPLVADEGPVVSEKERKRLAKAAEKEQKRREKEQAKAEKARKKEAAHAEPAPPVPVAPSEAESEILIEEEEVGLEVEDTPAPEPRVADPEPPEPTAEEEAESEILIEEEEVGLEVEDAAEAPVPVATEATEPQDDVPFEEEEVGLDLEEPERTPAPETDEPTAQDLDGPETEVDMPSAEAVPPPIEVDAGAPFFEPLGEDDDLESLPAFTITAEAIEEDDEDAEEPVELPRKRFFRKMGQ